MASRSRDTWLKVLVVKSKLPERRYFIVWIGPFLLEKAWIHLGEFFVRVSTGDIKFTGS